MWCFADAEVAVSQSVASTDLHRGKTAAPAAQSSFVAEAFEDAVDRIVIVCFKAPLLDCKKPPHCGNHFLFCYSNFLN